MLIVLSLNLEENISIKKITYQFKTTNKKNYKLKNLI